MPPIPTTSVFTYLGVFLLPAGLLLILIGANIIQFRITDFVIAPGSKTSKSGIILTVLGAIFLLLEIADPFPASVTPTPTETVIYLPTPQASRTVVHNTPTHAFTETPSATPIPEPTSTSIPTFTPFSPEPQQVKWGPVDGREPGICINNCIEFISWAKLKEEVEQNLLPQVSQVPNGSAVMVTNWEGETNFVVQIIDPNENEVGHIWFGPNPYNNWEFDGLVRIGYPPATVLDTFQRYSDGSYQR